MRITVTQEHIDKARAAYKSVLVARHQCCPIAQALKDATGEQWSVWPDGGEPQYSSAYLLTDDGDEAELGLSVNATKQALQFDRTGDFKPGTYVLREVSQ